MKKKIAPKRRTGGAAGRSSTSSAPTLLLPTLFSGTVPRDTVVDPVRGTRINCGQRPARHNGTIAEINTVIRELEHSMKIARHADPDTGFITACLQVRQNLAILDYIAPASYVDVVKRYEKKTRGIIAAMYARCRAWRI